MLVTLLVRVGIYYLKACVWVCVGVCTYVSVCASSSLESLGCFSFELRALQVAVNVTETQRRPLPAKS